MIERLKEILKIDNSDNQKALDMLYNDIYDILVIPDNHKNCDEYLDNFLILDFSTLLKVGLIRITKPHKNKLNNREKLVENLKETLNKEILNNECSEEEAESILFHIV